jgi:hypothetical protein
MPFYLAVETPVIIRSKLRIWRLKEGGGHSHSHSTMHNPQDGGRQADGIADLTSVNDTGWYPLDGQESTHNRSIAGSRFPPSVLGVLLAD